MLANSAEKTYRESDGCSYCARPLHGRLCLWAWNSQLSLFLIFLDQALGNIPARFLIQHDGISLRAWASSSNWPKVQKP